MGQASEEQGQATIENISYIEEEVARRSIPPPPPAAFLAPTAFLETAQDKEE
jgi:hypothetical protein